MKFKTKFLLYLALMFSMFLGSSDIEASEPKDLAPNTDLLGTEFSEFEVSTESEYKYDDLSYFISNVRKTLDSGKVSEVSKDYKILKEVDYLWAEGKSISSELIDVA